MNLSILGNALLLLLMLSLLLLLYDHADFGFDHVQFLAQECGSSYAKEELTVRDWQPTCPIHPFNHDDGCHLRHSESSVKAGNLSSHTSTHELATILLKVLGAPSKLPASLTS